jgi:16S rRNA (guanine(966)-N(2))-methyltransferase RsmD
MRIISGTHRGRSIFPPKNLPVRPTTDFAKESLFNILNNYLDYEGTTVLDLFCGTGNITYEFLSRGSSSVTCVDMNYQCCAFVKKTAEDIKLPGAKVIKSDVFSFLRKHSGSYDVIFADPPYELDKIDQISVIVFEQNLLKARGWLVVEHGIHTDLSMQPNFYEKRVYGNVHFSFFTVPQETDANS